MSGLLEDILAKLDTIESLAHGILHGQTVSGNQVIVTGLDGISDNLGLVKAGEFRSGKGTPGIDFTGIRMGAPGWLYSGTQYSIVGLNNETLEFGLCNTDGKIYAGGGKVQIGSGGIEMFGDYNNLNFWQMSGGTSHFAGRIYESWGGAAVNPNQLWLIAQASNASPWNDSLVSLVAYDDGTGIDNRIEVFSTGRTTIGGNQLQITSNINYTGTLTSNKGSADYPGYILYPKVGPYFSTSWDGDAKTVADNGVIDLSVVFGVPAIVKAIYARMAVTDETVGAYAKLGPNSTYSNALQVSTQAANVENNGYGIIPCDANGDVYASFSDEFDHVVIEIWAIFV